MDKTSNETLIALFEMLNERLYNIEQTNKTIVKHLKNQCIDKRVLDKDLFGFPIDVHTYHHGTPTIDQNTRMLVSHSLPDVVTTRLLSINRPNNFAKIRPFLPRILNDKGITKLENFVSNIKFDDKCLSETSLPCAEFGIDTWFDHIHNYVLHEYIKDKFHNVEWVLPGFEGHYTFVLKELHSVEKAVEYVESIFKHFECSLEQISTPQNHICITLCSGKYDMNLEILTNMHYYKCNMELMSREFGFTVSDINRYIEELEMVLNRGAFREYNMVFDDPISIECCIETLQDIRSKILGDEDSDLSLIHI